MQKGVAAVGLWRVRDGQSGDAGKLTSKPGRASGSRLANPAV